MDEKTVYKEPTGNNIDTADILAVDLNEFAKDFDTYGYYDAIDRDEEEHAIKDTAADIETCGEGLDKHKEYLEDIIKEFSDNRDSISAGYVLRAQALVDRLNAFAESRQIEPSVQPAPGFTDKRKPLYPYSIDEAIVMGETDQYWESRQLNEECAQAIKAAINGNYDGYHLIHDTSDAVIQQFGLERVKFILANTVQLFDYDGRISGDNKVWAKSIKIPDKAPDRRYYMIDGLSGLVDIWLREVRKTEVALNQVADNIIETGRHETTSGNYFVNLEEASDGVLDHGKVECFKNEIVELLHGSDAVSDAELTGDGQVDVNFYLAYCPNYEPVQDEIDEHGEDWPQQEPLELLPTRSSLLDRLRENVESVEQNHENTESVPKRKTNREV